MGTLHYLDDLKVREGKAGAEVHGTMVVQDTLCLEKAVTVAMGQFQLESGAGVLG